MWNGEVIIIKQGQLLTGRKELSADTGIPESTIERILKMLESEQQIEQEKTTKFRIITIINWKEYQGGQQTDNKRTTNGQQTDTNKNVKNIKNDKNIYIYDFWNEKNIIQHRKLTDKIKRKINGSLKDYSQEEILTAISNYDYILNSKEYYWTHKWTLVEFLQRGLEKFMDLETAKNNYLKNNNGFTDKKEYQKTSGDDFNVIQ